MPPSPSDAIPPVGLWAGSDAESALLDRSEATLRELGVPVARWRLGAAAPAGVLDAAVAAAAAERVAVFIVAASGPAALAARLARRTDRPVLVVPIETPLARGLDTLMAAVSLPAGLPVGTLAIGPAGARNAALLAVAILALARPALGAALLELRRAQTAAVRAATLD
jgi:5-(carboxyamino)imidazole ribonucleotide mutase